MSENQDQADRLRELAAPLAHGRGLVIEDCTVRPRGGTVHAVIVVDLDGEEPGSPDLDAVADLSREVSAALDAQEERGGEAILGTGRTDLEVTTPGAERPVTTPRQARRARGRLLRLRTTDGRDVLGRLVDVRSTGERDAIEGTTLILRPVDEPGSRPRGRRTPREEVEIPFAELAAARVEIELSRPDGAEQTGTTTEEG